MISATVSLYRGSELIDRVESCTVLRSVHVLRERRVCRLIHGHTHRPARHLHAIDGQDCERWVVPDW